MDLHKIKTWCVTWFKAARAPFLVVSLIPCLLGGIMAYGTGVFDRTIFLLTTFAVVMAHSAADFIDDYFDYKNRNLGNKTKQFHDSPLIDGSISLKQVLAATWLCLIPSIAIGVYLMIRIGYPVAVMALAGGFIVLFYTSPPFRLNYRGLGETMLFFAFGPLIVFGMYFVLTKQAAWAPLLVSIPLGVFTMNIGLVSNIFDYRDDIASGKKTLPVRFGRARAVGFLGLATFMAYLVILLGALTSRLPLWALSMWFTTPLAIRMMRAAGRFQDTANYTPAMTKAIALSSLSASLLCIAYGIDILAG